MSRTVPSVFHCPAIGHWRLHPGHAMGLRPRRDALLRIYCGRVWVTQGGPYTVLGRASGDLFLSPGDSLRVAAGARLVMEPLAEAGDERPVHFDWTELHPARHPMPLARERWEASRKLPAALTLSAMAVMRWLRGLGSWRIPQVSARR